MCVLSIRHSIRQPGWLPEFLEGCLIQPTQKGHICQRSISQQPPCSDGSICRPGTRNRTPQSAGKDGHRSRRHPRCNHPHRDELSSLPAPSMHADDRLRFRALYQPPDKPQSNALGVCVMSSMASYGGLVSGN